MDRCPITDVPVTIYTPLDGKLAYQYKTSVLGSVEFSDVAFWEARNLSLKEKYILAGVCRNNWLSEVQPTIIHTADLRELKNLDIPYDFKDRAKLLLHHLYNTGGKEYKGLQINTAEDSPLTYSSPEEFERIITYLQDQQWITWRKRTPTKQAIIYQDIRLTKEGIAVIKDSTIYKPKNVDDSQNGNKDIDLLELRLRDLIVSTLTLGTGKNRWQDIITGDPKTAIRSRIKDYVDLHPGFSSDSFDSLNNAICFCDLDHLKKIIINAYWIYFVSIFTDKLKVERFFDDFGEYRNAVKHNREVSEFVQSAGKTAIIWLTSCLNANDEINK